MLLSSRFLRRSMVWLLCLAGGTCAAQSSQSSNQFVNVPQVQLTGGRVTSFVTGSFQTPPQGTDFLYVNAPVQLKNPLNALLLPPSVTVGELLSLGSAGFNNLLENQIVFTNVSNVAATVGNFDGFDLQSYAFALTPAGTVTTNLCIYAGTGAQPPSVTNPTGGGSSYNGGIPPNAYPPVAGKSGCTTFGPLAPSTGVSPVFGAIAQFPYRTGFSPQLLVEDTANGIVYVLQNSGIGAGSGILGGISVVNTITLPASDGAGPMFTADLNGDGKTDLIVNNQMGLAATVYLGNGDGTFQPPVRVTFGKHIHSLLLQDMNGDGIPDMVAEVDGGVIEIHPGVGDGTFQAGSIGGTIEDANNGLEGNGGHLAGIAYLNQDLLPDIVTSTPIGLSVLLNQGSNQFKLTNIYNIGSGRNTYALGDFFGTGNVGLAVDSAEGIAFINGNGDGTFQTSLAYAALAPALSATEGRFRNAANISTGVPDAVVSTGATQAQLMTNDGTGKFSTFPGVANNGPTPSGIPANLWSNIFSGDFNGDGKLDLVYSLNGFPEPIPGNAAQPGLFVQFGNGDGTFAAPVPITPAAAGAPANNQFYGEAAVGDFNGDGITDLADIDLLYDDTLLGQSSGTFQLGLHKQLTTNQPFSVAATGYFKTGRTGKQDLLMESGALLIPYVNSGDGVHFTAMPAITFPFDAGTILLTDVDGDGNGDIVVAAYNPAAHPEDPVASVSDQLIIFFGNGDGTFGQPVTTTTPGLLMNLSRNDYLAAVADMNADGLPDIVLSDGYLVTILYNLGGSGVGKNRTFGNEQHFLAGEGINSLLVADVNGDGTPDLVLANGGATISDPIVIAVGGQPSINLTPNTDVNTGGITVLLNHITTSPVTETLVASPEPSGLGATFTLTATITPSLGVALPTGSLQFSIDGTPLGSPVTVVPGTTSSSATYTVPAGNTYAAGTHTITAYYVGDSNNSPLTITATHAIQSGTTTTTLFLCIGPTVACPNGTIVAPAPPYPTSLAMYFGQSYNGVISATSNDGSTLSASSVIDFNDDYNGVPTTLCTLVIGTPGECLPPVGNPGTTSGGVHIFTAVYMGDATHTTSTSIPVTINVAPDTTTATLAGTPNPSPQGQPVTLTATLTGNFAAPTGPVVFTYGTATLGTANLVAGSGLSSTATLTTSALPLGKDVVTANYAATLNFNAASASFTETITTSLAGSFTITVAPTPVNVGVGYSGLAVVTVTPQNGFAQGVNLTCTDLPTEASCFFDSPTIPAGGGTTNLVVGTTAPHTCGTTTPYFLGSNSGGGGPWPMGLGALAGVAMLFVPGKKRWLRSLIAIAVVAAATQMTGCGTCTDLGTRPATYTFQVVGTATGSSTTQAQSVTLTVTI